MAHHRHSDFSDAPTMIMSSTKDAQLHFNGISPLPFSNNGKTRESCVTKSYCNYSTSWTPTDTTAPIYTNPSHKRLRDETGLTSNDDGSHPFPQQANTSMAIRELPVHGEGGMLLNPSAGLRTSAESPRERWFEGKMETELKPTLPGEDRPQPPPSRKSVRLDPTAPSAPRRGGKDGSTEPPTSPPKSSSPHPTIDDLTYALGIGWTRLASEDPDIQAAARGWARYLENHYSTCIHGAEILLKSKGLNAFLVATQHGFYLFSEDLLEGRLVGREWDTCLQRLRNHPITFEGEEALRAERTPAVDAGFVGETNVDATQDGDMNNANNPAFNACMDLD